MLADIRGFTQISEQRLPYDVVFILNRYFASMGLMIEGVVSVSSITPRPSSFDIALIFAVWVSFKSRAAAVRRSGTV